MIDLIYESEGRKAEIGFAKPFSLKSISGLGFDSTNSSYKVIQEDGEVFSSSSMNKRFIDIEVKLIGNAVTLRRELASVFRPKTDGKLIYTENNESSRMIYCRVEGFNIKKSKTDTIVEISLECANLYFYDLEEKLINMALWEESFSYPLYYGEEEVMFGNRIQNKLVNCYVDGDVKTELKATMRINGTVDSPKLTKISTGEHIQLEAEFTNGDVVVIDFREMTVEKNGENIFHFLSKDSRFFKLELCDNIIGYEALQGEE
ncbi:MAG: phage distal tail protein, partial [Paraclostridium sp.]